MGLRLALVTTKSRENVVKILKVFDLLGYFEFVLGFEDTAEHKPSLESMKKAISMMGLGAEQVIGNSDADVKSVKGVGLKVISVTAGVTTHESLKLEEPDYIISDIASVPQIIEDENNWKNGK